jgi:hypothetical protein
MRFAIGATVALAAAVVRADDASSSEAAASPSVTVAKPTFTVRLPSTCIAHVASNTCIAHKTQGTFPRAIHRRLGVPLEPFAREEGRQGRR